MGYRHYLYAVPKSKSQKFRHVKQMMTGVILQSDMVTG